MMDYRRPCLLEARLGKTRQMIVRSIKPFEAENSLTSAFLAMLPSHAGRMARPPYRPEAVPSEGAKLP